MFEPLDPSDFAPAYFSLSIYPKDSQGIPLDDYSDILPHLRTFVASESQSSTVMCNNVNGTITSNFLLTMAGSYSIVVYFNGSVVSSFNQIVAVFPGDPFFPNFHVVRNHHIIKTSEIVDVIVIPVDKFMNSYKKLAFCQKKMSFTYTCPLI
jgi:hypothetical protein